MSTTQRGQLQLPVQTTGTGIPDNPVNKQRVCQLYEAGTENFWLPVQFTRI